MSNDQTTRRVHRRAVLRGALTTAVAGVAMAAVPGTGQARPRTEERAPEPAGARWPAGARVVWIGHL